MSTDNIADDLLHKFEFYSYGHALEILSQSFPTEWKGKKYQTIYADPPWQFQNRTGKMAPEHKRLHRYATMTLDEIKRLPVQDICDEKPIFT